MLLTMYATTKRLYAMVAFLENVDNCRKLHDYIEELAREELDDEW